MNYKYNFNQFNFNFKSYEDFGFQKNLCRCCPIGNVYNQVVPSSGNKLNPTACIIGEAPGKDELIKKQPFVGKSGSFLRNHLTKNGINESNSFITNLIPCRPQNNKFPKDKQQVHQCKTHWLERELILLKPKLILLVGSKPLEFILNMNKITEVRGMWFSKTIHEHTFQVMPTYHPSYVLRTQYSPTKKHFKDLFMEDLNNFAQQLRTYI